MAILATKITDVIVPDVFNPYVVERTSELSEIEKCGIIGRDQQFDKLASAGGKLINMPFWTDLTGDDEVLSDSTALSVDKIDASQDISVLLLRGKAWGVNDLAKALSGDDPMGMIGDLVAAYWARRRQATLFSLLKGVFAAASMANAVHDISAVDGADTFTGATFLDACQLLGDAAKGLTAVAMHSQTHTSLRKLNLLDTVKDSENNEITSYMGRRVIIDDGCPVAAGTYTTYLFGAGAIALGNGAAPTPTEMDRDSLLGEDYLINRQHFMLHPRGVKFTSAAVVGAAPTNAELETAANWLRVYEQKNIRLVKFLHKLEA